MDREHKWKCSSQLWSNYRCKKSNNKNCFSCFITARITFTCSKDSIFNILQVLRLVAFSGYFSRSWITQPVVGVKMTGKHLLNIWRASLLELQIMNCLNCTSAGMNGLSGGHVTISALTWYLIKIRQLPVNGVCPSTRLKWQGYC